MQQHGSFPDAARHQHGAPTEGGGTWRYRPARQGRRERGDPPQPQSQLTLLSLPELGCDIQGLCVQACQEPGGAQQRLYPAGHRQACSSSNPPEGHVAPVAGKRLQQGGGSQRAHATHAPRRRQVRHALRHDAGRLLPCHRRQQACRTARRGVYRSSSVGHNMPKALTHVNSLAAAVRQLAWKSCPEASPILERSAPAASKTCPTKQGIQACRTALQVSQHSGISPRQPARTSAETAAPRRHRVTAPTASIAAAHTAAWRQSHSHQAALQLCEAATLSRCWKGARPQTCGGRRGQRHHRRRTCRLCKQPGKDSASFSLSPGLALQLLPCPCLLPLPMNSDPAAVGACWQPGTRT